MLQGLSLPLCAEIKTEYGGWDGLRAECQALGTDGIEGIWAGTDIPADFPKNLLTGYHLTFYPDWLDFYRQDTQKLLQKFGSMDEVRAFYGGDSPEILMQLYRDDLARAIQLGANYVVFHVSDVSLAESYTYRFTHTDAEVIDAAADCINVLLRDCAPDFDFLVENQWWAGFTFTRPELTARLLDRIAYPRKGILLDTGHLMNTNLTIQTEREGIAYLHAMLDAHGSLTRYIRGVHLHQSLSGAYVRTHTGIIPQEQGKTYVERFSSNYGHILRIDRHEPWTDPAIGSVLDRIAPDYLTHELNAGTRRERFAAVARQQEILRKRAKVKCSLPQSLRDSSLVRGSR